MTLAADAQVVRVLLVEDSPEDADLIAELLYDAGTDAFELEHVTRLAEGLARVREGGIGLVLLDMSLPDSHGVDTFHRVHEAAPELPIVVLSGLDDQELAMRTVREGAQEYLVKGDVDARLIVRSLRYAVERKRAEVEHANFVREQTARQEAEAAVALRDDFLAAASHDLKTPLTTIKTTAQLLRRRAERDGGLPMDRLLTGLQNIETTSDRMTAQVNELLDVARLRMGQPLELARTPTDLVELARRVVEAHQQTATTHRLRLNSSDAEIVGEWDEVRLQRVLENLISNAVKYSPEGGDVAVEVEREDRDPIASAVLSVRDQGVGIPPEDLPYVFERYRRAGNVTGRIEGAGVGLAVVQQIVERHGGAVAVESQVGAGTTFTVRLPLAPQEAGEVPV